MRPEYTLVHVPAGPLHLDAFLPKDRMARMAGALATAGREARVLDYATPAWMERQAFFASREGESACWYGVWRFRREAGGVARWLADIAGDIVLHRPGTVCYFAETPGEMDQCARLAARVGGALPGVRQELVLPDSLRARSGAASPLAAVHDTWRVRVGGGRTDETGGPTACYEPSVYPALFGGGKLHLFPVSLGEGAADSPEAAEAVLGEIAAVQRAVPLGAFHLDGHLSASTVNEVAAGLLAGGHRCQYSTGCVPGPLSDSVWALARASGCRAVEWLVPSGSQRLLDDHYGARFCVSHGRRTLRMCRLAGIYCAVRFLYPCAADDPHTRAESLYFAEKAEPDSVVVAPAAHEGPRQTARAAKARAAVGEDLRRKGFPVQVEAWQGLMARAGRFDGRENRILGRYESLISNGDWPALADEIAAFNRVLSHPVPQAAMGWTEALSCAAAAN